MFLNRVDSNLKILGSKREIVNRWWNAAGHNLKAWILSQKLKHVGLNYPNGEGQWFRILRRELINASKECRLLKVVRMQRGLMGSMKLRQNTSLFLTSKNSIGSRGQNNSGSRVAMVIHEKIEFVDCEMILDNSMIKSLSCRLW